MGLNNPAGGDGETFDGGTITQPLLTILTESSDDHSYPTYPAVTQTVLGDQNSPYPVQIAWHNTDPGYDDETERLLIGPAGMLAEAYHFGDGADARVIGFKMKFESLTVYADNVNVFAADGGAGSLEAAYLTATLRASIAGSYVQTAKKSTTAGRPTEGWIGMLHYDTTLTKPIWASAVTFPEGQDVGTITQWKDAAGTTV